MIFTVEDDYRSFNWPKVAIWEASGALQQPIPSVICRSRPRCRKDSGHNKNQRAPEPLWAALAPHMYQPSSVESPVNWQNRLPLSVPVAALPVGYDTQNARQVPSGSPGTAVPLGNVAGTGFLSQQAQRYRARQY